jgi:hypothetical protein
VPRGRSKSRPVGNDDSAPAKSLAGRVVDFDGERVVGTHGNIPDDADWKVCWFDCGAHGLEKEAGDVGEESAFALTDASLGDHGEKLGNDAADVIAVLEIRAAGEEFGGDGLGFGVGELFGVALMDDAETVWVAVVGIGAAITVGRGELATI